MSSKTFEKKLQILEKVASSAGAYYAFNLTKDVITGYVHQSVNGVCYNSTESARLPEQSAFSAYIDSWIDSVSDEDKEDYLAFFSLDNLLEHFRRNETELTFTYWTKNVDGSDLLAEQHIYLYDDDDTGDVLGITYLANRTRSYRDQQYRARLEAGNKNLVTNLYLERKFLDVLSRDYATVYQVNLLNDTSMLIKVAPGVSHPQTNTVQLRRTNNYTERIHAYCDRFVLGVCKEEFLRIMDRENLMRELKKAPRIAFRYRCRPNLAGHQYFEAQIFRVNQNLSDGNTLIGFRYIDDVVSAELRQQIELEERLEKERAQNEVLSSIGKIYYAIMRINVCDDSYEMISCRDEAASLYTGEPSARAELLNIIPAVIPEQRERMQHFLDIGTLQHRMGACEFIEEECKTLNGDWRRVRFIPNRWGEDGNLTHVLFVTQTIQHEKEREETLISIAESANDANEAKSEFISQVAHDIRTPMNAMFGFLEIAQASIHDPEKIAYSLEKIRVAGEFLKDLVNDVLDISRMEHGKMKLQPVDMSLDKMLTELCVTMESAAKIKNQQIRFHIHDMTHDFVHADPLRLQQIYSNVLSNATKYTPTGGMIEFELYQKTAPGCDRVTLVANVTDNGVGMSQEFMDRMFSKFERATDTRINKVSGYGLGLSIVKQLVDMMDGTIDVESRLGQGSSFHISLELPIAQEQQGVDNRQTVDIESSCAGMHLLVAEDNPLNQEVITELLAMHHITCDCVDDGVECLEWFQAAQSGTYDAILMDMQMPNMNGLEATVCLRRLPTEEAKHIPIIAMTANALKDDIRRCLDAGMNMHLSKPVDMKLLLRSLAEIRGNK